MNNTTKKIVASVTALTCALWMIGTPALAALTESQIQSILSLLESFGADTATVANVESALKGEPVTPTTPTIEGCTIASFDRNLKLGTTGDDVNCLQIILNSASDTQLAATGVGSPGNETSYFGPLTKAAVIKFQEKYAEDVLASYGLTTGTGYVGSTTRAKLNELLGGVIPPTECTTDADCPAGYTCTAEACVKIPVAAGLTVALAATTPASTSIISYGTTSKQAQVLVPFTTVNFTAGSEGSVTVTTLKFTRTGIAADSNLDNTYLYEGDAKLLEGGSLSSKVVTFNDASGIFTVPAGETKSITLKGNLNSAASAGKTIGFSLVSAGNITSDASAVSGTFPVSGNLMTVATATDLGYAMITGETVPTVAATISPQDDYQVWKFTLTANQQNLDLERIVFSEVGSILTDDLQNFELYYGGTLLGTTEMDSNNQVIFDLADSPFRITKGQSKILKLHADIVKGSNRTFKFTVQYPTDIMLKDANYGVYVGSYLTLGTWSIVQPTASYTVGVGTLSVTKRTDSPTGNVSLDGANVSLAKYDFKVAGEDVKVTSLRVAAATTGLDNGLDNGMVFLDGVQVGSTIDINEYSSGLVGEGTSFTFGTSFIIAAGTTSVVEIKADIKDKDTNSFSATNTIQIYLLYDDTYNNAQAQSSLTILDVPASDKAANSLTVQAGALTFTKSTSYGNQSTVRPASEFKIGSFSMLAGSTEGVNVDSITVTFSEAEAAYMESLLLKVGADQIGSTKVTVGTSNLFSVDANLAKGGSKIVDVYADILSTAATIIADVSGTGTTVDTSASVSATSVTLQTVSIQASTLTVALASDTPDTAIVTGQSTDVELAKYTFSALYEAFTISDVTINTLYGTDDDIVNLYLKYKNAAGETVTSDPLPLISAEAAFVAMTFYVPANGNADLTVYGNLNAVAPAGYANAGDQPQLAITYFKADSGSQSALETTYSDVVIRSSGGNATAVWSNDQAYVGNHSVRLIAPSSARAAARVAYGETLSTLVALTTTIGGSETLDVIWNVYYPASADGIAPYAVLLLDTTGDDAVDAAVVGGFDYVYETGGCSYSSWNKAMKPLAGNFQIRDVDANNFLISGTYTGPYNDEAAGAVTLAALDSSTDWAITGDDPVVLYVGTSVTNNTGSSYVDDIIIGGTTYAVEQIAGNEMLLYKTKPTVALTSTYSSTFSSGVNVLYPFTVAADAKGDVGLKTLIFNVTTAMNAGQIDTFKFYRGSLDITNKVTITGSSTLTQCTDACDLEGTTDYFDNDDTSIVTVTFATEEIITKDTSQTYYLKGSASSIGTVGDSVQTYLKDDTLWQRPDDVPGDITGNFIWTDRHVPTASHSEDEDENYFSDWLNGYLVDTLPGSIVTLSK